MLRSTPACGEGRLRFAMRSAVALAVASGLLFSSLVFAEGCSSDRVQKDTDMSNDGEAVDLRIDDYAWSHRPLVVFAASEDAHELAEQRKRLQGAEAALKDRDMVVIEVIGREAGTVDGQPLSDAAVAHLVERYDPSTNAFEVLLIGKDTGVKLRRGEPVTTETLFELIDSMPMRQREMRKDA